MHRHLSAFTIIAFTLAACDARQDQAQLRPSTSNPAPNPPPMSNPSAIIITWVGPSDRPNPPTIFWAEKAALDGASNWIAQRDKSPIRPTPVETGADALICMAKATPAATSSGPLIEVIAWNGASSAPVRLNQAGSTQFLLAAIGCVGESSSAAGFLRSLQTLVTNASR
ncbi:MAG: hypothetical protein JNK16_08150 [Phycisphaerales bacterium]|nr:hypothetical protein [Phycisphaerales bacterium]